MKKLVVLFLCLFVVSACSGGSDPEVAEPSTTEATTSTLATTTTLVETTTTTIPLPLAPLTGLPFEGDAAALSRPAVVVKVDNHPRARPQTGLDRADMVIELRAEGVTRFMAVYHSDLPEPVGPVRSARTSDFDILTAFNSPAFAYSGANAIVDRGLGGLGIYARYEDRVDFYRDRNRNSPHNLYVNPQGLQDKLPSDAAPPSPWFSYGSPEQVAAQGRAISGEVTVVFTGSPIVEYQWDRAVGGWIRDQDGQSHSTISGDQLAPTNVVIMSARYGVSRADAASPELISVGSGALTVLTDGRVIEGTWSRLDNTRPPDIADLDGNEIILTPGQTWVMYPDRGVIVPES